MSAPLFHDLEAMQATLAVQTRILEHEKAAEASYRSGSGFIARPEDIAGRGTSDTGWYLERFAEAALALTRSRR